MQLRVYADDVRYDDKFAFDNIEISDTPIDVELLIVNGCWGSAYDLEVQVFNNNQLCVASPNITSVDLTYTIDGSAPVTQNFTGLNIPYGGVESVFISGLTIPGTTSTVGVWASNPNGLTDQITCNDTVYGDVTNWPNCNDFCSNATNIGLGTTVASQTSNATTSPGIDPPFNGCGNPTIENTVWYQFTTSPSGGDVTVTFENISCTPSSNGIQVSILELVGAPCDTAGWNEVYCANNGNINDIVWGPINLPPNTTYYIAVDGFAGNDCDFDITLDGQVLILPIALQAFSAECLEQGGTEVQWTVGSNPGTLAYLLERSEDGLHFEPVKRIETGGGSLQTTQYTVIDEVAGPLYYRLQTEEADGSIDYSDRIYAACEGNGVMASLQPNPADKLTNLHLAVTEPEKVQIQVYDATGRIIWGTEVLVDERRVVAIPTDRWRPGSYRVTILTSHEVVNRNLVVVH